MSKSVSRILKPTSLLTHNETESAAGKPKIESLNNLVTHDQGIRSIEDYHLSKISSVKVNNPTKQIDNIKLKIKFSKNLPKSHKSKSNEIQCYMKKQWKK